MTWRDYALCRNGVPVEHFFDEYKENVAIAKAVDEMCLSCPVFQQCQSEAVQNREYGVWAGVFRKNGQPYKKRNMHKTPETWQRIKDRLGEE